MQAAIRHATYVSPPIFFSFYRYNYCAVLMQFKHYYATINIQLQLYEIVLKVSYRYMLYNKIRASNSPSLTKVRKNKGITMKQR